MNGIDARKKATRCGQQKQWKYTSDTVASFVERKKNQKQKCKRALSRVLFSFFAFLTKPECEFITLDAHGAH